MRTINSQIESSQFDQIEAPTPNGPEGNARPLRLANDTYIVFASERSIEC
eukprot:m.40067 g.40067  ORF g.40067 m.40067 type:complete len:50 (+) comp13839_c1_seq1:250-399(+)